MSTVPTRAREGNTGVTVGAFAPLRRARRESPDARRRMNASTTRRSPARAFAVGRAARAGVGAERQATTSTLPMSALLRARARETRGLRSEDSSAQVRRARRESPDARRRMNASATRRSPARAFAVGRAALGWRGHQGGRPPRARWKRAAIWQRVRRRLLRGGSREADGTIDSPGDDPRNGRSASAPGRTRAR